MTTITSVQVPELLQPLIDSRLDTIDRMLLGRMPRSERLEIVREVESQIFELLRERCSDEPTREDVLAVLARLDPPEAYLAEEPEREPGARPRPLIGPTVPFQLRAQPAGGARRKTALASGVLGIAVIALLILAWPLLAGFATMFPDPGALVGIFFFMLMAIAFIGSLTAISLAAYSHLQGRWAIAGLVTGLFALVGSLSFTVLGLLDF